MIEKKSVLSTRVIAEIISFVALATALSFVIVYTLPQGGSITAGSMVPILWLALRRGSKIGFFAGVVYGIIQFLVLPYFIDPIQWILDYPLAFAMLGIAGLFRNHPPIGVLFGIIGRFLSAFVAGVVYWAPLFAPEVNPFVYSSIYNGSYLLPELFVSGFIIYLIQKNKILDIYL